MPTYDVSALKQLYDTQGYVIVPGLISPSLLPELEAACARAIAKTREGAWPHRRTVGRQFPPYDESDPDSWGVQHVMHPDLGEDAFARWYTSDELVNVVCELLGCGEEDLQMGESLRPYCIDRHRGAVVDLHRVVQPVDQPDGTFVRASMASR